ncbi:glycoside hydrolase superfamily [Limtongia smithiae]|uniref:glycoside hydrolase superfamily n=1 Tax=Limtongia smithiae TaxID=1125753 RepID=UPI0034D0092C
MAAIDVEKVLNELTTTEKIDLLSGIDMWHTKAIERVGVPSVRVSDGPNGVRGTRFFNGVPAACFPCGTALGATFDDALLERAGACMGEEAKAKGVAAILGPTVNIQRGPLGGRGFESFSEDPVVSGMCASAIIRGIQSTGVTAVLKHFVANDLEHMRNGSDSLVSQRALREIYLKPFQIAIKNSQPGSIMTSYNKVNGVHASHNPFLLQEILRKEWGWDGLVMSDWFGTYSTRDAIEAGLDLEMPGPTRFRGQLLQHAMNANLIPNAILDARAKSVLQFIKRAAAAGVEPNAPEEMRDTSETAALLREIAGEAVVLLKNDDSVLPFSKTKKTVVIGPNACSATYSGGGSATLMPYYAVTPYDAIAAQVDGAVSCTEGAVGYRFLPLICFGKTQTPDGDDGLLFETFLEDETVADRECVDQQKLTHAFMFLVDYKHPKIIDAMMQHKPYYARITALFKCTEAGTYEFGMTVVGTAKLYVNGKLVVDNATKQTLGDSFFGVGTVEERGSTELEEGNTYEIIVEFGSSATSQLRGAAMAFAGGAIRIGFTKTFDAKAEISRAVDMAKDADQVVLSIGTSGDWESEGYDRESMKFPGYIDELVRAVLEANKNTAVVIQSGMPCEMPWAVKAKAIVQAWFGGNEAGTAIADVVFGDRNPSGKLPVTFPKRLQDNPAYLSFRTEGGRVWYSEDVFAGYRYYDAVERDVEFPFGFGLSYSRFSLKDFAVTVSDDLVTVTGTVVHEEGPSGAEVIQVYISQTRASVRRAPKELKGYQRVAVTAGGCAVVKISIDVRQATSFYDESAKKWVSEKGVYTVHVGTSSRDTTAWQGTFEVAATEYWTGL